MAEKSGFFNALLSNGQYDRTYSADDYCNAFRMVANTGVCYSNDDELKVTVSGMRVSVSAGRAIIDGHYYINDSVHNSFTVPIAPTGDNNRIDRVVLRLDSNVATRSIKLVYKTGAAAVNPSAPSLTRSGGVYEIALADIRVSAGDTSISAGNVTDRRDNNDYCGWVSVPVPVVPTLLKKYVWRTTLTTATNAVQFDIPQYDATGTDIANVYVNGLLEVETHDYTLSGRTITFKANKTAGTEIIVTVFKSIDGSGLGSVADEVTQLQNDVALLNASSQYDYYCNGIDDNVQLSTLAAALLADGATNYDTVTVRVIGAIGVKAANGGAGTASNPYQWFKLGGTEVTNKRIIFDFADCTQITVPIAAGTHNIIFYGASVHVINASVVCSQTATDTTIKIFNTENGVVYCENCRFWITSYNGCYIARTGTFKNCRGSVANSVNNSYCFYPSSDGLLRVVGGEYYAYTGAASAVSAIIGQSGADAVSILGGVNAPTNARSGYYQTNAIYQVSGGGVVCCTDMITALPLSVITGISNIRGTIAKSKPNLM